MIKFEKLKSILDAFRKAGMSVPTVDIDGSYFETCRKERPAALGDPIEDPDFVLWGDLSIRSGRHKIVGGRSALDTAFYLVGLWAAAKAGALAATEWNSETEKHVQNRAHD